MASRLQRLWCAVSLRLPGALPVLVVFLLFLTIYGLTAGTSLGRHSLAPHFVYLAESFLHGRLDLRHVPDPPYDLTPFAGRWYVSFPPLPSLLMVLPVAIRGLAVSDIAFSVLLGAISLVFLYIALTRLGIQDTEARIWLCLLLGLGTPLWYCAALGSVWYTAHVAAVTCLCLYSLEVVGQNRPILAGLWLGLGFLSRAPTLLAFPLSLTVGLNRSHSSRTRMRFTLLFALGVAPALLGQAAYNWARFGDPFEFGYRWMNSPGPLLERQVAWGQFSLHFLPENLYTLLVRPPLASPTPPHVAPDPWGMGLLFTCPALLLALPTLAKVAGARCRAAFHSRRTRRQVRKPALRLALPTLAKVAGARCRAAFHSRRTRQQVRKPALRTPILRRWRGNPKTTHYLAHESIHSPESSLEPSSGSLCLGLWLSILFVTIPSLLYFNTGSYQFGYRFALDWLPLAVLLVALGTGGQLRWWGKGLIVASVLMHLWGVLWMYPNFNGQPWHVQYVELARHLHPR
jgi:hypothetical protein